MANTGLIHRNGTQVAAADLSGKQFYLVKLDANGQIALAGSGDRVLGVLQNKPTAGQICEVGILGRSKVIAGGTITPGPISSDANGAAVAATTGKAIVGYAYRSAAAGEILDVEMLPGAVLAP